MGVTDDGSQAANSDVPLRNGSSARGRRRREAVGVTWKSQVFRQVFRDRVRDNLTQRRSESVRANYAICAACMQRPRPLGLGDTRGQAMNGSFGRAAMQHTIMMMMHSTPHTCGSAPGAIGRRWIFRRRRRHHDPHTIRGMATQAQGGICYFFSGRSIPDLTDGDGDGEGCL